MYRHKLPPRNSKVNEIWNGGADQRNTNASTFCGDHERLEAQQLEKSSLPRFAQGFEVEFEWHEISATFSQSSILRYHRVIIRGSSGSRSTRKWKDSCISLQQAMEAAFQYWELIMSDTPIAIVLLCVRCLLPFFLQLSAI